MIEQSDSLRNTLSHPDGHPQKSPEGAFQAHTDSKPRGDHDKAKACSDFMANPSAKPLSGEVQRG